MSFSKHWLRKLSLSEAFKHIKINPEFKSLEPLIAQLPEKFQTTGETIYKARNELKITETSLGMVVIKSFGKAYFFNRFAYAWLRPSKAKRSFEYALRLQKKGIDTPYPIAYIECFRKGMIEKNMYIYLYAQRTDNMRKVLVDKNYPDRENLLQHFARFTFSLYQKEVYHKDYSPGNILFEKKAAHYHFSLVDINRMEFGPWEKEKKYNIFRRLMADKETLQIMAKAYAACYEEDEDFVFNKIAYYSNQFISKRSRKKKLKKYMKKNK